MEKSVVRGRRYPETRKRIGDLAGRIDALINLIGDTPELYGDAKRQARGDLKGIKHDFTVALHRIHDGRNELRDARRLLAISAQDCPGAAWRPALEATRAALIELDAGRYAR